MLGVNVLPLPGENTSSMLVDQKSHKGHYVPTPRMSGHSQTPHYYSRYIPPFDRGKDHFSTRYTLFGRLFQ
jgi:hypothetical protein